MNLVERKLEVIEAAARWAEVLRGDPSFSERVRARDAFSKELDEALMDTCQGAVSVEDVERILVETSRYFSGDHVHAGVVVREVRKRLRVLAGGR